MGSACTCTTWYPIHIHPKRAHTNRRFERSPRPCTRPTEQPASGSLNIWCAQGRGRVALLRCRLRLPYAIWRHCHRSSLRRPFAHEFFINIRNYHFRIFFSLLVSAFCALSDGWAIVDIKTCNRIEYRLLYVVRVCVTHTGHIGDGKCFGLSDCLIIHGRFTMKWVPDARAHLRTNSRLVFFIRFFFAPAPICMGVSHKQIIVLYDVYCQQPVKKSKFFFYFFFTQFSTVDIIRCADREWKNLGRIEFNLVLTLSFVYLIFFSHFVVAEKVRNEMTTTTELNERNAWSIPWGERGKTFD